MTPLGESDGEGGGGALWRHQIGDGYSRQIQPFCSANNTSALPENKRSQTQKCEKSESVGLVSSRSDRRPGAQIVCYYHYFPPF